MPDSPQQFTKMDLPSSGEIPQDTPRYASHPPVKVVVGYAAHAWDHAIPYLRIVAPLRAAGIQLIHGNQGGEIDPQRVALGDMILIQREFPFYHTAYQTILSLAREQGKPIIYEIDDLLFDLPPEHPDHAVHYYTPMLFPMLQAVADADWVTTSTPALEAYIKPLNPHVSWLPNYLDERLWSARLPTSTSSDRPIVIGYMGSETHLPDLEEIAPALESLLQQFKKTIVLRFWGAQAPAALQKSAYAGQIDWQPLSIPQYSQFAAHFSRQQSDIFIAPLKDTLFNQCKSPIKYLEYSIQGIPGVYSRVASYESLITQGENGLLASSTQEWVEQLSQLIEDAALRLTMGRKAQDYVQQNWMLSPHANQWAAVYQQALAYYSASDDSPARAIRRAYSQVFAHTTDQVLAWRHSVLGELEQKRREAAALPGLQAQLAEQQHRIDTIQHSTTWKLKSAIFPAGSWREKLVQKISFWLKPPPTSNL